MEKIRDRTRKMQKCKQQLDPLSRHESELTDEGLGQRGRRERERENEEELDEFTVLPDLFLIKNISLRAEMVWRCVKILRIRQN
jgi:hypothetical protein